MKKSSEKCRECDGEVCDWWVAAEEYDNCFWLFVEQKSNKLGYMPPMTQAEIAELLGIPHGKVGEIYHNALEKLQEHEEFEDLIEIFYE